MLAPVDLGAVNVDGRTVFIGLAGAFVGLPGALICAGAVLAVRLNTLEFSVAGEIIAVVTPLCVGMAWSRSVRRAWGVRFASLGVLALCISATLLLFFLRYPPHTSITIFTSCWPLIFATAFVSAQVYGLLMNRELAQISREKILAADASADPLTGILNRRGFSERLENLLTSGSRISLLMIDADKFKTINDTYGHPAGDAWLVAFVRTALAMLPREAVLARLGGEEFAIILVGDSQTQAAGFAEQLRREIESLQVSHTGNKFGTTVSIGIAQSRSPVDISLLQRADLALYFAKSAGRNTAAEVMRDGTPVRLDRLRVAAGTSGVANINSRRAHQQTAAPKVRPVAS